jgi:hypothetical protein
LFYDKKLEAKLAPGQTIIDLAVQKFEKECFTGHRISKIIKKFIEEVSQMKPLPGRTDKF